MRILLLIAAVGAAWGAEPIATASANGQFHLRGVEVPATAAAGVAIADGDELRTGAATVTISFRDGAQAVGLPASHLRVYRRKGIAVLQVIEGEVRLRFPGARGTFFCAGSSLIEAAPASQVEARRDAQGQVTARAASGQARSVDNSEWCAGKPDALLPNSRVIWIGAAAGAATTAVLVTRSDEGASIGGVELPPLSPAGQR